MERPCVYYYYYYYCCGNPLAVGRNLSDRKRSSSPIIPAVALSASRRRRSLCARGTGHGGRESKGTANTNRKTTTDKATIITPCFTQSLNSRTAGKRVKPSSGVNYIRNSATSPTFYHYYYHFSSHCRAADIPQLPIAMETLLYGTRKLSLSLLPLLLLVGGDSARHACVCVLIYSTTV